LRRAARLHRARPRSARWRCSTCCCRPTQRRRGTNAGHTPLLLLLGARAEAGAACDEDVLLAVLERLLNEGVALDAQDQRGLCALHLAAMHGLLAVVQRLLREGANRSLRDSLGRTPHDLALLRGYVDIAAEFEPARAAPRWRASCANRADAHVHTTHMLGIGLLAGAVAACGGQTTTRC
jgi:hypothetical protein